MVQNWTILKKIKDKWKRLARKYDDGSEDECRMARCSIAIEK
jgi:hypothetical protein